MHVPRPRPPPAPPVVYTSLETFNVSQCTVICRMPENTGTDFYWILYMASVTVQIVSRPFKETQSLFFFFFSTWVKILWPHVSRGLQKQVSDIKLLFRIRVSSGFLTFTLFNRNSAFISRICQRCHICEKLRIITFKQNQLAHCLGSASCVYFHNPFSFCSVAPPYKSAQAGRARCISPFSWTLTLLLC